MKKLLAVAAFMLASTAAQAQYTFEYGGRTIRIDPDRGTVSIPGVYDNSGRPTKRSQDAGRQRKDGPAPTEQAPATANTSPGPAAPPVVATVPPPASANPMVPAAATPLGVWLTEEKQGRIRIEPCGVNLCGYSVDAGSNQNRDQILFDMKPDRDSRWSGRILDPNSGSSYDSTIALTGADTLRVQGCAFNGMFCGGQTWSRLN